MLSLKHNHLYKLSLSTSPLHNIHDTTTTTLHDFTIYQLISYILFLKSPRVVLQLSQLAVTVTAKLPLNRRRQAYTFPLITRFDPFISCRNFFEQHVAVLSSIKLCSITINIRIQLQGNTYKLIPSLLLTCYQLTLIC